LKRLAILAILLLALGLRLAPLASSPLPHNVDGFDAASTAEGFIAEGAWAPTGYSASMPAAFLLLAQASAVTGLEPLALAQPLFALAGLAAVVAAWAFVRRGLRHDVADVVALAALATLGTFVYFTSVVMKQTMAFALVPLSVALVVSGRARREVALGAVLLAILPLFHHLSTLLAVTACVLGLSVVAASRGFGTVAWRAIAVGVAAGWAVAWFASVRSAVGAYWKIMAADAALYAALVVLALAVLHVAARRARSIRRSAMVLASIPLAGGALLLANAFVPVFEGGALTPPLLAALAVPLLLVLVLAAVGWAALLTRRGAEGDALVGGLAASVVVFALFAVLRGLDATSFYLAQRAADFAAPALALGLGVGAALLAARVPRGRGALVAVLVALPALTTPIALAGDATLTFSNSVSPAELAAARWASEGGSLATDTRLSAVARYAGLAPSASLAFDLARGAVVDPPRALVAESWAARGGEAAPIGVFPVDVESYAAFRAQVYANGHARVILAR